MDLNTRRYRRVPIDVPVQFQVHLSHRNQVDLVGNEASRLGRSLDVSEGGMSFQTRVFLPRGVLLELDVERLSDQASMAPGAKAAILGRVQRCTMVGRQPTYQVAVAFVEVQPEVKTRIQDYVSGWKAEPGAPEPVRQAAQG